MDATVWVDRDYLVDVYRTRVFAVFRPTTIATLPAVEQQTLTGTSLCTITVGVAASQALDVTTSVDEFANSRPVIDPCAEGRRVIEAIVSTLPPL